MVSGVLHIRFRSLFMDMSALDLKIVEEKLGEIAKFLHPILSLANGHATDFITKRYWDHYIPKCIQDELLSLSKEQLNFLPCSTFTQEHLTVRPNKDTNCQFPEFVFNKSTKIENEKPDVLCMYCHGNNELPCKCGYRNNDVQSCCSNTYKEACNNRSEKVSNQIEYLLDSEGKLPFTRISDFSSAAKASSIEGFDLAVSPETLLAKFGATQNELFIGTFMSEKKSHEVEIMSKVCSSIADGSKCKLVGKIFINFEYYIKFYITKMIPSYTGLNELRSELVNGLLYNMNGEYSLVPSY